MESSSERITAERLFEASEAVLLACVELADAHGGEWPDPPSVMGSDEQPECLCPFSKWEVEQATDFLVRMGILERTSTRS